MKIAKKILFTIYFLLISFTVLLFLQISFYTAILPDNFYREKKEFSKFGFDAYPSVTAEMPRQEVIPTMAGEKSSYEMTLMLYGIVPIKNVTIRQVETPMLIPSGEAFGLKMLTNGVMVTEYGSVEGTGAFHSPAKEGGILTGDIIISVNGKKTDTAEELSKAVQLDPEKTELTVERSGETLTLMLTPEKSVNDGLYKLGIWTRDSCAGIGTLTYYDRKNRSYGGLGHSVCDAETGTLLPLAYGETVPVCVNNVVKGVNGRPGELCGTFMSASAAGSILLNTDCGVFGLSDIIPNAEEVPMAFKQEVKIGEASILTTLNGMSPKSYRIVIEKVDYNSDSAVKNMIIRIDDEELLQTAGGIVQGMSGSPIIQNGKLIGAVTHVFVNDITRGYAIFSENMYNISSTLKSEAPEESNLAA